MSSMLYPGIKLGPKDWLTKIEQSQAKYAEIWYRINKPNWYTELFSELNNRGISFGLHFWGTTTTGHEVNLAYPGSDQIESIKLVKNSIDQAADFGARYVNLHLGNRALISITFDPLSLTLDPTFPLIPNTLATNTRNQALIELGTYANNQNVDLLIETIPQNNDRDNPTPQYPADLQGLEDLCKQRLIGFTNDFCHTFAMDRPNFNKTTYTYSQYTKVAHINTLTPPYNGTDEHRGILPTDFQQTGVFPSKSQFIELFKLLQAKAQSDVWLIGEPNGKHVENYFELVKLLKAI